MLHDIGSDDVVAVGGLHHGHEINLCVLRPLADLHG
jgi:hypothetical protein